MTFAAAPFIALPIVGTALVLFVFITRLVNSLSPLPQMPVFDVPEDEQPTVAIPVVVPVRASVTVLAPSAAGWLFADRSRSADSDDAQWLASLSTFTNFIAPSAEAA